MTNCNGEDLERKVNTMGEIMNDEELTDLRTSFEESIEAKTLSGPFDINTHKRVFVNYLEVIVDELGVVHYATPSHSRWLENKFADIMNVSYGEASKTIRDECMTTFKDPIEYLTEKTKCVALWDDFHVGKPTDVQIKTMLHLKDEGLYHGDIPTEGVCSHVDQLMNRGVFPRYIPFLQEPDDASVVEETSSYTATAKPNGVLFQPKPVADITLCGCINFRITESDNFIRPTPTQIRNLRDTFCIDVKLYDEKGDVIVDE